MSVLLTVPEVFLSFFFFPFFFFLTGRRDGDGLEEGRRAGRLLPLEDGAASAPVER